MWHRQAIRRIPHHRKGRGSLRPLALAPGEETEGGTGERVGARGDLAGHLPIVEPAESGGHTGRHDGSADDMNEADQFCLLLGWRPPIEGIFFYDATDFGNVVPRKGWIREIT